MVDEEKKEGEYQRFVVSLLPVRDIIVFPHMVVPLFVGREKSIQALEEALAKKKDILLVAQKKAKTNDPTPEEIYKVGTLGAIIQLLRLPDGTVKVLIEGRSRVRVVRYLPSEKFFEAEVEPIIEKDPKGASPAGAQIEALVRSIKESFETYIKLNRKIPPEMLMTISAIDSPGKLADTVVSHLNLKLENKQEILEIESPALRLEKLVGFMQGEIEILQIERRIRNRVKKQMERSQKEYYLNEQMQAIQKELGERDEFKSEIIDIEKALRQKKLSEEAEKRIRKELKKLKMMSPMSAEATVV
ncbi:MAG: LON peptidase substrate-binding domain-containing protein, partial [Deltaproteobacteria bacterium]